MARQQQAIPRATKTTYKITRTDKHKKLSVRVRVTGTLLGCRTVTRTSAPTGKVKR